MSESAKQLIPEDRSTAAHAVGLLKNVTGITLGRREEKSCEPVSEFLDLVIQEMRSLRGRIDVGEIDRATKLIIDSESSGGRVHVTGVGKSEHIARYLASLLSSTGTPAYFLHATECVHGSAGQVCKGDVAIVISNSGATPEILKALRTLRSAEITVIGISNNRESPLAKSADMTLYAGATREDGLLNLAPRASVLAKMYLLCALSVALEAQKGLTREQYSRWHPAGVLGATARSIEPEIS
jgi:D-arabinose 5-phosphate isomerase GutQ